jgi:hypothetical protein
MKFFKYEDLSIFFIPMVGAVAGGSKEKISQKEKAIVLLAGPVPGIIIGLTLFFIGETMNSELLFRLSYAFVILNLLNLLPIYPLDGGQLLKTLFLGSREIISTIFIVASIAVTIWFAISKEDWFLLIIPYFLIIRMIQQIQLRKIRKNLDYQHINYNKNFSELSDEEYWKIRDEVAVNNTLLGRVISPGNYTVSEKENSIINYIKSVLKTRPVKDLGVPGRIIFLLIWIASFAIPILYMSQIRNWF